MRISIELRWYVLKRRIVPNNLRLQAVCDLSIFNQYSIGLNMNRTWFDRCFHIGSHNSLRYFWLNPSNPSTTEEKKKRYSSIILQRIPHEFFVVFHQKKWVKHSHPLMEGSSFPLPGQGVCWKLLQMRRSILETNLVLGCFNFKDLGFFWAFFVAKTWPGTVFFSIEYWESRILVSWILRVGMSSNCEFTVRNAEYLLKMSWKLLGFVRLEVIVYFHADWRFGVVSKAIVGFRWLFGSGIFPQHNKLFRMELLKFQSTLNHEFEPLGNMASSGTMNFAMHWSNRCAFSGSFKLFYFYPELFRLLVSFFVMLHRSILLWLECSAVVRCHGFSSTFR